MSYFIVLGYRICQNKRPVRLIFRSKKLFQNPSRPISLCTPPFEKSPIKSHRFCVLPPLKITHQSPLVLCTPPFEKARFLVGACFGVGVYCGKYGICFYPGWKKISLPILLQTCPYSFLLFCILKGRSNLCLPPQWAVLPDTKVWPFLARNRRPAATIFGRYWSFSQIMRKWKKHLGI